MNTSSCPVCGSPIVGRTDKKYCSDQCRASANNEKKMRSQQILLATNQVLRRNRTILKTLCPYGKATVRKDILESMGFKPASFTSIFITQSRQVYYLCYDFAFTPLREHGVDKALIVGRQEYMKEFDPWRFVARP